MLGTCPGYSTINEVEDGMWMNNLPDGSRGGKATDCYKFTFPPQQLVGEINTTTVRLQHWGGDLDMQLWRVTITDSTQPLTSQQWTREAWSNTDVDSYSSATQVESLTRWLPVPYIGGPVFFYVIGVLRPDRIESQTSSVAYELTVTAVPW